MAYVWFGVFWCALDLLQFIRNLFPSVFSLSPFFFPSFFWVFCRESFTSVTYGSGSMNGPVLGAGVTHTHSALCAAH
ncbi:hypothetical protein B0T13DRAFT_480793 [Neurospora crassa]|nr:hypothetical protein B0T13DRAFT_480793 [Neurospora crassa]